jgi:hypothetical protein
MSDSAGDGRKTIEQAFRDFIRDCRENDVFPESSIKALENRLLGVLAALNAVEAFRQAGAIYLDQINRPTIRLAKRLIRKTYLNPAQAGGVESAISTTLRDMMDRGLFGNQTLRERDLNPLKYQRKNGPKPEQLSQEQSAALTTRVPGDDEFERRRNEAIFGVCMLVHGFRSGMEIWKLNECDYNRYALELTVTRERGHRQTIALRKIDRDVLDRSLAQKHQRIKELRDQGIVAEDEDALFISNKPRLRNGKLTLRLDTGKLIAVFDKIRSSLGFPSEVKAGWLRHNSCTRMQQNAMCLGFHEGYVSTLEDHGEEIERLYYSCIIGPEIEILARSPEEAIGLLERIAAHGFARFLTKPYQLRHLSVLIPALLVMGRLQLRIMLGEYRDDLLDLDHMPRNPFAGPVSNVASMFKLIYHNTILCLCPWISR